MELILPPEPEMTLDEFVQIRDFIHEKSGIFFSENRMYLVKNRLSKRIADLGLHSYLDYLYHIKYDSTLREFNQLMNLVTTNETSFFRNEPQLLSFSDEALPLLMREKTERGDNQPLRIWSAGCSTGEEPYTLAIIAMEKLKPYPGLRVEIIANDISEQVLQRARRGEYNGTTLRNVRPDLLSRYFDRENDMYMVKREVKALVNFLHLNLNDRRKVSLMAAFDVVFCRNVMIYFSDTAKKQLVRDFFNALNPGGYLYIGHSETLHGVSKAFKLVYFKNALVYQKETVDAPEHAPDSTVTGGSAWQKARRPANVVTGAERALELLSRIKLPHSH